MNKNNIKKTILIFISVILLVSLSDISFCRSEDMLSSVGYIYTMKNDSEIYTAESLKEIKQDASANSIEFIEPNYIIRPCDSFVPNDTYFADTKWSKEIMNFQPVWDRGYFGNYPDVSGAPTIALIDSGLAGTGKNPIMGKHEDLDYSKIFSKLNTYDSDSEVTDDMYSHGTFVAGIIAAQTNNLVGIMGDMPNININVYRCLNDSGWGTVSNEIKAINSAIENNVDVINISLAFGGSSSIEKDAIEEANNQGIIICAASGNDYGTDYKYPASQNHVISVGSIDSACKKSDFSQYNDRIDIVAPGENIISLMNNNPHGYKIASGTSCACPQVSALAAMCKSIDPTIDHDRFMELLKSTSRDAGTPGYDTSYGWGIVDYGNMLDALVPEDNSIWAAEITGISSDADYTGNEIKFENLKITMPDGTELSEDSDYTVAYYNNKNSEMGMLTIQGIGEYQGRINKYFAIHGVPTPGGYSGGGIISPPSTSDTLSDKSGNASADPKPVDKISEPTIKKIKAGKKSFTITWKKTKNIDGYQLQYSTSKTFKKSARKTINISKKKTSYTVKKLKANKKYYVRMRGYKILERKSNYYVWTKLATVNTK